MLELQKFVNEHRAWAKKTFGDTPKTAAVKHLQKEVKELLEEIERGTSDYDKTMEFADCMILLLHAADKNGIDVKELFKAMKHKFSINQTRRWPAPNADGVAEHIK